jgi:tetratricopeptide (TPR) repeat protein
MEETDYIEKLKSAYPTEGGEISNEALALADEAAHAFPQSAKLWCIRGDLILLGAGEPTHEIADALASYEQAIAVDPKCAEAYEEIGYFYDLVMDDEERAKPFFRQAELLKGKGSM